MSTVFIHLFRFPFILFVSSSYFKTIPFLFYSLFSISSFHPLLSPACPPLLFFHLFLRIYNLLHFIYLHNFPLSHFSPTLQEFPPPCTSFTFLISSSFPSAALYFNFPFHSPPQYFKSLHLHQHLFLLPLTPFITTLIPDQGGSR